jgi:hypothetical protein
MNLRTGIELVFASLLVFGAAFAFTLWHEPGCGVLMIYFALRRAVYGRYVL